MLFGEPVPERARQTGTSERTLDRKTAAFRDRKMESFFSSPKAKRRVLPPTIRRAIVDLKAEHPPLNVEESAKICGVLFGRRPDGHTVKAVLEESAIPRKVKRRFERYHEAEDVTESRLAVVTLHRKGWADKSIADYMEVDRSTVNRVRKRFEEHRENGLEDRPVGRPRGVQKVDLRAMVEVRRMQENPELGEFRGTGGVGADGNISEPPHRWSDPRHQSGSRGSGETVQRAQGEAGVPSEASYRHEIWTSDVRYLEQSLPKTANVYVVAILENYSRAMLASAVTLTQNTNAYLSVLHAAIERHGSPNKIVTDGGGIFRSDQAKAVYRALNMEKEEIERGQAWQSFIQSNFNFQRRMADFYFARAESWEELVAEHDLWLERHNTQRHQAQDTAAQALRDRRARRGRLVQSPRTR